MFFKESAPSASAVKDEWSVNMGFIQLSVNNICIQAVPTCRSMLLPNRIVNTILWWVVNFGNLLLWNSQTILNAFECRRCNILHGIMIAVGRLIHWLCCRFQNLVIYRGCVTQSKLALYASDVNYCHLGVKWFDMQAQRGLVEIVRSALVSRSTGRMRSYNEQ